MTRERVGDGTKPLYLQGDLFINDVAFAAAAQTALSGVFEALAPGHAAGQYYGPNGSVTATRSYGANELRLTPYRVRSSQTFDRFAIEVTTAGGAGTVFRLGIWNHNSATGRPGTLLLDAGTVAGDSAAGVEKTISQLLSPGWYWLGSAAQVHSGSPVLRAYAGGDPLIASAVATGTSLPLCSYVVTGISGAFATLVGAGFGTSTVAPVHLLRAV